MIKIKKATGTIDYKDRELIQLKQLESDWTIFLNTKGFSLIRTPTLEEKELFIRGVGEFSDIVSKEMFVCDNLVLKPEGTAPIMRYIIENNIQEISYLSYFDSFYRKEKPQKGRFRQFYQYGFEIIGDSCPQSEIAGLKIINDFYQKNNIKYKIIINYLPNEIGLKKYEDELFLFLKQNYEKLSENSKKRFDNKSFLRILDSKEDLDITSKAPEMSLFYSSEEKNEFDLICKLLKNEKIEYQIDRKLVRGLDYYQGLVFEVIDESNSLGAQKALGGGGRYNKLAQQLGSKNEISAFGFAGGAERLLYQLNYKIQDLRPKIGIISFDNLEEVNNFIKNNEEKAIVNYNYDNSIGFKKIFKRFDKIKMDYVIMIGDDEIKNNYIKIKNMKSGNEKKIFNVKLSQLSIKDILDD